MKPETNVVMIPHFVLQVIAVKLNQFHFLVYDVLYHYEI